MLVVGLCLCVYSVLCGRMSQHVHIRNLRCGAAVNRFLISQRSDDNMCPTHSSMLYFTRSIEGECSTAMSPFCLQFIILRSHMNAFFAKHFASLFKTCYNAKKICVAYNIILLPKPESNLMLQRVPNQHQLST